MQSQVDNSSILDTIGLSGFDYGFLFIGMIVLFLIVIVLIVATVKQNNQMKRLKSRVDKFMGGKSARGLEETIVTLLDDYEMLKENAKDNARDIKTIYKNMRSMYQKMGIVKYDAFQQMGGQLSFCLALLDEDNNGFIINSVHSTEGCYSYTKEIREGESDVPLGKEEEEAMRIALG